MKTILGLPLHITFQVNDKVTKLKIHYTKKKYLIYIFKKYDDKTNEDTDLVHDLKKKSMLQILKQLTNTHKKNNMWHIKNWD